MIVTDDDHHDDHADDHHDDEQEEEPDDEHHPLPSSHAFPPSWGHCTLPRPQVTDSYDLCDLYVMRMREG